MVLPFGLLALGGVLAYSGLKNKTIFETLKGVPGSLANTPYEADARAAAGKLASFAEPITGKNKKPSSGGTSVSGGQLASINSGGTGGPPSWGGAKRQVEYYSKGFPASSRKRSTRDTASGGISDHWTGARFSYAKDIPAVGAVGDRIANAIARRLGRPDYKGGSWLTVNKNGFRFQIGWEVPDHYDHVHFGARRLDHPNG